MGSLILQVRALEIWVMRPCNIIYFFADIMPGNLMNVVLGNVIVLFFAGRSPGNFMDVSFLSRKPSR